MKNKVILLDGVGINLKTAIIESFRKSGYPVLVSNSPKYVTASSDFLPYTLAYSSRFEVRFAEIRSAVNMLQQLGSDLPLIVDRSAFNQIIFGIMTYDNKEGSNVFDDYTGLSKVDLPVITRNALSYRNVEDQLGVTRFLIRMYDEKIIEESLDMKNYKFDIHAMTRIDAFSDLEYYLHCQRIYSNLYSYYVKDYHIIDLIDVYGNVPNVVESVKNKILNECI